MREIIDLRRFFWRTPKSDKPIVFYSEHGNYYPYFEGLIRELTSNSNQLCYVTSDIKDPILQEPQPNIEAFYIDKLLPIFMAFVNCKVFIMTLTDLGQFHLKRSVYPVHYIYVFHSLVSTHMIYREGAFDHYDSILCCNPHQVSEIRRREELKRLPPKKLVEAGYHRLEQIYNAYQKYSTVATKRTILIAPSWGTANILETCGKPLIKLLLEEGYEVIVRPHPETVKRFPNLVSLLASRFGNNSNFTLELSIIGYDSLLRSDVLISDYSGISLEYAFGTERPVIFIDTPPKVRNPRYEELGIEPIESSLRSEIGKVIPLTELGKVPQTIQELLASRDHYKLALPRLRNKHVFNFGKSSEVGASYIKELL